MNLASLSDSFGKILEDMHSGLPIDTGVRDAYTLFQSTWSLRRDLLITFMDIGFDHDTNNSRLALSELVSNDLSDFWLVAMVFIGIS